MRLSANRVYTIQRTSTTFLLLEDSSIYFFYTDGWADGLSGMCAFETRSAYLETSLKLINYSHPKKMYSESQLLHESFAYYETLADFAVRWFAKNKICWEQP